jgi:hypothetical protein
MVIFLKLTDQSDAQRSFALKVTGPAYGEA